MFHPQILCLLCDHNAGLDCLILILLESKKPPACTISTFFRIHDINDIKGLGGYNLDDVRYVDVAWLVADPEEEMKC